MFNTQRKGSSAPMWWGIFLVLAFTAAATINYNWEPAQASAMAQSSGAR